MPITTQDCIKIVKRDFKMNAKSIRINSDFPFAALQNPDRTLENAFEGLQKAFQTIDFGFAGLQKAFRRQEEHFAALQKHFPTLEGCFAGCKTQT